jgi:hypothetical protein
MSRWTPNNAASSMGGQAAVSVLLIAAGLALPESERLAGLRGLGGLGSELSQARANGYYEGLLNPTQRASSRRADDERIPPAPPGWKPFIESGLVEAVPGYLHWRFRPRVELTWNGSTFHINSLRCRGPEVSRRKPAGTYRVVVLGSSNTLGHGVNDEAVYVRHLERWLNEVSGPAGRVEVVNLSVSGHSPTQRLLRLCTEVEGLDANWILCDVTALDSSLEELHLNWVVRRDVAVPFAFVRECLSRAGVTAADPPDRFASKLRAVQESLLDGTFAGWSEQARRLRVPLTVVILPRADLKMDNPYIFGLIRRTARRHGLDTIDLSGIYRDLELDTFRIAPWDRHPSPLGHRLIFEQLRAALLRRGRVPGLIPPTRLTSRSPG